MKTIAGIICSMIVFACCFSSSANAQVIQTPSNVKTDVVFATPATAAKMVKSVKPIQKPRNAKKLAPVKARKQKAQKGKKGAYNASGNTNASKRIKVNPQATSPAKAKSCCKTKNGIKACRKSKKSNSQR